ncbi:hypothetical protein [Chitinophaga eiseniae]|nr:hypothetical protein [Chitinophaga eiseniae]
MKNYCGLVVAFALMAAASIFSCKKDKFRQPSAENVRLSIDSLTMTQFYALRIYVSWNMPDGYVLDPNVPTDKKASEHGICYNYTGNPTISDFKKKEYAGNAPDYVSLYLPESFRTIYFRVYVIINDIPYYSSQKSISTSGLRDPWEKELISGDFFDIREVVYDDNYGFAILGSVHTTDSPDSCWARLIKVDGEGNIQWSKDYRDHSYYQPYQLLKTRDGYAIISGRKDAAEGDILITKINASGVQVNRFVLDNAVNTLKGVYENSGQQLVLYTTKQHKNESSGAIWTWILDWPDQAVGEINYNVYDDFYQGGEAKKSIGNPEGWTCIRYIHIGSILNVTHYGADNHYKWNHEIESNEFGPKSGTMAGVNIRLNIQKNPVVLTYATFTPRRSISSLAVLDANTGRLLWQGFIYDPTFSIRSNGRTMATDFCQDIDGNYYSTGTSQSVDSNRVSRFIFKHNAEGRAQWYYRVSETDAITRKNVHSILITPEKMIYLFGTQKPEGASEANTRLYIFRAKE